MAAVPSLTTALDLEAHIHPGVEIELELGFEAWSDVHGRRHILPFLS